MSEMVYQLDQLSYVWCLVSDEQGIECTVYQAVKE